MVLEEVPSNHYRPARVLVEYEGDWYPGTRHYVTTAPDGTPTHLVTWQPCEGMMRLTRFLCAHVKLLD